MSYWTDRNYSAVTAGVRSRKLKTPNQASCQQCGKKKAVKHHDDYSKPLEVMYLCQKCHCKRHKLLGWGIGGKPRNYDFTILPIGGFVFVKEKQQNISAILNGFKTRISPGLDFKSFTFNGGTIVFRTK